MGNNIAILQGNVRNINQAISETKSNANYLAESTKSAISSSLNIITSAANIAASVSKACADTQSIRKSKLINQTNELAANAVTVALGKLKPFENELALITARLNANSAESKFIEVQNCAVVVTRENLQLVINCIQSVSNAYYSYLNSESNSITTQFNNVQSIRTSLINGLLAALNTIISDNDMNAKTEAEAILDCAGLSARKRVETTIQRLASINGQVEANLGSETNNLLDAISRTKTTLNNNLANATTAINALLRKVNDYATYISYIAPDKTSQVQKQVEQVRSNSTAQLDKIRTVYAEVFLALDSLNATVPQIYRAYRNNYTAISSFDQATLISANISERLNTAALQNVLNGYIVQLVNEANKASRALSDKIDEYNLLIDKVNAVSNIRLSAEFAFAINVTRSIETIYLLGGVEFRYSPSTVVVQLNNSAPVQQAINAQNQITNVYAQVKSELDSFKLNYNNTLLQVLNPIKALIDNELLKNPYINPVNINNAVNLIYSDAQAKIIASVNLILQNASNINNNVSRINITAQLNQVEDAVRACFNNPDQHAAVICSNKVIADFNNLIATLTIEGQQVNVDLLRLPSLLQTNINKIIQDAAKLINDLYVTVKGDTTAAIVKSIENNISLAINDTSLFLDKIKSQLNNLTKYGSEYVIKVQTNIDEAIKPLVVAINATLSVLPGVNLTRQLDYLNKLLDEAKLKANSTITETINKYLFNTTQLNQEYQNALQEFKIKVTELNQSLIITCKRNTTTDEQFRACIESYYNDFKVYINQFLDKINKLNNNALNLSISIDTNLNANLTIVLNQIFNLSNNAGIDIYNTNNITAENIIDFALEGNVKTYNITPILFTILQVNSTAQELDKRNEFARSWGNQTLFTSASAIYDIVGVGRALCGQKSVDQQLRDANAKVVAMTNYVFTKAPQLSPAIAELLQLSSDVNTTLFYEISQLDVSNLLVKCPKNGKLFDMYTCILRQVAKFGAYYDAEIVKIGNYTKYSQDKLRDGSAALANWRNEYVLPESAIIVAELEKDAENFYIQCNATAEKLINYSLGVSLSHYNTYQPRISSNFAEINLLADRVIARNYSGYNISSRLEAAAAPVYAAISAVLASANRSIITDDVRLALQYLIGNYTWQYNAFIANFTAQSRLYKQQAVSLLENRDALFNSHNFSYLYAACYNPNADLPLTSLVTCNNLQTYRRMQVIANNNTLNSLLAIKNDLITFDSKPTELIGNYTDFVEKDFSKSIYFFAYRLYVLANLPVPPSVSAQVEENRCIKGVTIRQFYCVVTT